MTAYMDWQTVVDLQHVADGFDDARLAAHAHEAIRRVLDRWKLADRDDARQAFMYGRSRHWHHADESDWYRYPWTASGREWAAMMLRDYPGLR